MIISEVLRGGDIWNRSENILRQETAEQSVQTKISASRLSTSPKIAPGVALALAFPWFRRNPKPRNDSVSQLRIGSISRKYEEQEEQYSLLQ